MIDKEEMKKKLSPKQYEVACEGGTEAPFSGQYWDHHEDGTYSCVVCGAELFSSDTKFDSGTGWPSFSDIIASDRVKALEDTSSGMTRTEVRCANCDAHLGHVFPDGPGPTGQRYCINSASLDFISRTS